MHVRVISGAHDAIACCGHPMLKQMYTGTVPVRQAPPQFVLHDLIFVM
jgi:hypothetical protein